MAAFASPPASLRLQRLAAEAVKDPAAVERFWAEVSRNGAPLIEQAPEAGTLLVTFLWRGDVNTRRVVVMGDGARGKPADNQMEDLGLGVWFRSYVHRSDARFRYSLSP